MFKGVVLKKGKEGIVKQRHHWIFSGAIDTYPKDYQDGELAAIQNSSGEILGYGFFNRRLSLAGRIVAFGDQEPYAALRQTVQSALNLRKALLYPNDLKNWDLDSVKAPGLIDRKRPNIRNMGSLTIDQSRELSRCPNPNFSGRLGINYPQTTAYRLINGEGDGLPGLIIDYYDGYLVTQTGALGMRHLLPFFIEEIRSYLPIKGVYDKSKGGSVKEEGMEPREEIVWGEVPDEVIILENGIQYLIPIKTGQKTGFFLDHREMRCLISEVVAGKRVLNGFCYTGGFTLAALKGGAIIVDSVDISAPALQLCQRNLELNGFEKQPLFQEDLFEFLSSRSLDYDLAILDPPAFAKKKKDIPSAIKGYKRLFGLALRKMPPSSYLLLSSCSHYITEPLFGEIIRTAALEAHRAVRLLSHHRLALDHPINPFHPESAYLKSSLLYIA